MIWFFVGAAVMAYLAWWVGIIILLGELLRRIKALEAKHDRLMTAVAARVDLENKR